MKVVADVLGVARSNLVEQIRSKARPRGSYRRADDDVILTAIRAVTDVRPTYGYRRVTAILNRTRRATGEPLLNHKRVFRLMKQSGLLLQRHTGVRPVRAHEGRVIASASNQRWSSDALEITRWNGEVVRVAFAIDTHDREVIAWVASTGGITGQMVRDLMLACVEDRFGGVRVPHLVQWLADNGSAYSAIETLAFAAALGLLGTVRNSVCGRRIEHQAAMALVKRSPKMTANCALAMTHSRGPIFHAFSERFKTR